MKRAMILGVDEAGRGPVIGPIVVAALGIPESEISELRDMGVNDSKVLSPSKRTEIRNKIMQRDGWEHHIISFSAEQIAVSYTHLTLPTKA